ncbi:MAG: AAA family ATPase, partial [Saezia sp.]
DARIMLWHAGVPFDVREQICRIIGVHQLPFYALADDQQQKPEFMIHKLSWELPLWKLCLMAKTDMLGRIAQDQKKVLEDVEVFRLMALEQGCLYEPKHFPDSHTRVQYFRGASISPDYLFYAQEGSTVVLMSGLPASGKDHWVAKNKPDWPVASYDDARKELNLKYGKNEGKVSHHVQERVKEWLRNKQPFVWNATHLSKEMRQNALDLLCAYHAHVTIVYLEQDEAELLRRNRKRDTTLTNAKLLEMLFKWEIPLPTEAHEVQYAVEM